MGIPLPPEEEPNRASIQLYHHVASQALLRGKDVLEVSCGHGGGAAYVTRALQPRNYIGLDLNATAIDFCRERHRIEELTFEQGDSENLPFHNDTFDVLLNVEASHCYPAFHRFLMEVARVLKPGGYFAYADFRFSERFAEWESALASAPLRLLQTRNINTEVLHGINANSGRAEALIKRHLPKWMRSLGREFAGLKGSRVYESLESGDLAYRSYCFERPQNGSA